MGLNVANKGFTVGRYANRIGNSQFTLNGVVYKLAANEGRNILHGGPMGFYNRDWTIKSFKEDSVIFSIDSPDLDQGFPGNLSLVVEFRLVGNALHILYDAVTDKDTFVNFTNHTYFNLNGLDGSFDHTLWLNSDCITELDKELIPTGKILNVVGTFYDYTKERLYTPDLDINYPIKGEGMKVAGILKGLKSGITLKCETTEPGVQVYNEGNQICLETQHFPDSPNHPEFPSTLLKGGNHYFSETIYTLTKD